MNFDSTLKMILMLSLGVSAQACTSVPTASQGNFLRTDTLSAAKGTRAKRLETAAPTPPLAVGAKLRIQATSFLDNANISSQITEDERALILNSLNRSACEALSSHFEIVAGDATGSDAADVYVLRTGVTRLIATGRLGAAIGNASGFVIPVIGLRPPIGLGGLTVEFELLKPDATQAAAMVWSRSADVISSDAAASRIGDAYGFTETAAADFAQLVSQKSMGTRAMAMVQNPLGSKSDPACEAYGQTSRVAGIVGFLGVPVPPEMSDKGAKPPTP